MKKKLRKSDIVLLAIFFIGSISSMIYVKSITSGLDEYKPVPLTDDEVKKLSNNNLKSIMIYPILTQYAYQKNGFYDFYSGKCASCNVVNLDHLSINATYNTGKSGFEKLVRLSYPFITDVTVDRHPEYLKDYDEIILLHNEYMTKTEFNTIVSHKNVVYLYPNSAYVEVSVNYTNHKMTLVRGHGYPDKSILNGFGYVTTSQFEYDTQCKNYGWKERPNGIGLTCWPEYLLTYDRKPLQTILDYPEIVPPLISGNVTKSNIVMPFCYHNGTCTTGPRDYSVP